MLRPGYASGEILTTFRQMFRTMRRAVAPGVFDHAAAAQLRARLEAEGMTGFFVADRGRYQVNTSYRDEPLFTMLRQFASAVAEEPLELAAHRWLLFTHGSYQLIRGDERPAGRHLELTADFSSVETDQGESIYFDGRDSIPVPQWPLSVALVERHDSLYRYDRYLNHLIGSAEVWRLRLSLRFTR